jgi:hypothetical protein
MQDLRLSAAVIKNSVFWKFQGNMSLPSSGWRNKPSKKAMLKQSYAFN